MDKFEEIVSRHQAATKGPWRWHGYPGTYAIDLVGLTDWLPVVMGFNRWGMRGAQPIFSDHSDWAGGILRPLKDFIKLHDPANPRRSRLESIENPDAIAIERSWEDIDWLINEVRRLRGDQT